MNNRGLLLALVFLSLMQGCLSPFVSPLLGSDDDAISCTPVKNPAIVLSFDDQINIRSWNATRDLFNAYEIRATFFVDRWQNIDAEEMGILQNLSKDGHEIGFHTVHHADYFTYLEANNTAQDYYEREILPGLALVAELGFSPTSFAYPHGHRDSDIDEWLLANFTALRGTSSNTEGSHHWRTACIELGVFRSFGIPHEDHEEDVFSAKNLTMMNEIAHLDEQTPSLLFLNGHGITDGGSPISETYLELLFDQIQKHQLHTILMSEIQS